MRHWSKTMTIWDRYGSLVKTNSGTTDSQRQFILRSHTQTHTLPLCEIIRLQAEVACVLCGCRCDLVGLCYGLKEPGDTEEASPQRGLLQGLHFPDRLTPASHVLECVLLCPLFISNQFLHPSIPPVLLPPTILPFLSPPLPLHPSVPLRELQILSEAKSILQWEQPSQQRASAAALKLPLQLLYLTSRTHSARTYTPPAFTLWICAACTKHPNIFFFSRLSSLTPTPLAHLFLKWLLMFFVGRRRIWERIMILRFNQWELFQWGLSLSLCIVQVITTAWYSHKLGRRAGFSLRGRKEVWGRMDERWWRRREKRCYLASRSRGQHCCAAAAKSYQGSSGELFHSQPHSSPHTISHSTILSLSLSHDVNASILFFSRVTFS